MYIYIHSYKLSIYIYIYIHIALGLYPNRMCTWAPKFLPSPWLGDPATTVPLKKESLRFLPAVNLPKLELGGSAVAIAPRVQLH